MSDSYFLLEGGLPKVRSCPNLFDEIELLTEYLVVHFLFERLLSRCDGSPTSTGMTASVPYTIRN
ncbi:hypothetical protein A2U01_0074184, partial [Trifolium medium]|nr:hypothetical protein [Trifolium medium]